VRIPSSILARVRGPAAAIAIAGCSAPAPAAAPPPAAPPPPSTVVAAAPPDPVAYASADEDARLARVDDEATSSSDARTRRIERLADARRNARLIGVIGNGLQPGWPGIGTLGDPSDPPWGGGCMACGRG
jgi:hypothetical protein